MFDADNVDGGVHLALGVAAYEFPESADDWCLVKIAIRQGDESFDAMDPAIEATELPLLRDWFRALATDRLPQYASLTFTEPCIAFEFLARDDQGVRFVVRLSAELRPSFPLRQFGDEDREWRIVFHLSPERLNAVASAVDTTFRHFPPRRPQS